MKIEFDHVAVLVNDIERGIESIRPNGWVVGEIESFPAEGTKEVYIGPPSASGKLLLIEAIGDGPYQDAFEKRGAGLHHIALNVDDMMAFMEHISGSGWYLHPKSLHTLERHKTVWLARPGVRMLIEVVHRKLRKETARTPFISRIEVPLPLEKPLLASVFGLESFQSSETDEVFMTVDGVRHMLDVFIQAD